MSFSGVQITTGQIASDSLVTGPYVDEVIFRVIANQSPIQELNWSLVFNAALISGSGIVFVFYIVIIFRERQNLENI